MAARAHKGNLTKTTSDTVWSDDFWQVLQGELKRGSGRPRLARPLFRAVAEKIPFEALDDVRRSVSESDIETNGIYVAHDSMGVARYVGRGSIFTRLKARHRPNSQELKYFSFYVVAEKTHEREIETLLIRSAGPQLHFNSRKKRVDIQPGNVRDYEPGTVFYERQNKRGRKKRNRRGRRRRPS